MKATKQHTCRRRLPIDPDGLRWAAVPAAIVILAFCLDWTWLWIPALLVLICILAFFRDPPRRVPRIPGAVVSPADGRVDFIRTNEDPAAGPVGGPVISIFLSVFNVHINRCPYRAVVESVRPQPGTLHSAMGAASSQSNKSNWIYMTCGKYRFTVRQIAGLIARQIVCRVQVGQSLRRGERIGLIRFGSRTELFLPPEARVQAEPGQRVKGGVSVLAYLPEDQR